MFKASGISVFVVFLSLSPLARSEKSVSPYISHIHVYVPKTCV